MISNLKKFTLIIVIGVASSCKNESASLYEEALVKFEQKDYTSAKELLTRAIDLNHDFADALVARGSCHLNLKNYEAAVDDYSRGILLGEKHNGVLPEVYFNRGQAYFSLKNYDSALVDFTITISLDSEFIKGYYERGNVWFALGQIDSARTDYQISVMMDSTFADGYFGVGNTYSDLNHGIAIDFYSQAIALKEDPDYYFNRGLMHYLLSEYREAVSDFTSTIQLNDKHAHAFEMRGNANDETGNPEYALADFDKAIEIDPNYASAYFNRGITKNNNGDTDGACADFKKALELGYVEALTRTGNCP